MPVTNEVDRAQLKALGLDPDAYNDPVIPVQTEQQNPVVKSSPLGAGVRSALRNLTPSAVGLGTSVALSELTPFVSIPAGVGAGMLTTYLQNKLIKQLPDAISKPIEDSEQQDLTTQPVASAVGGVAGSLPFLRPDIKSLATVGKSLIGKEVTPEAAQILKNLTLNAGLQGGIGATVKGIQQGTLTPDLDRTDVINALGGALLNKPTTLGNRMGLHGEASIQTEQQNPVKTEAPLGININTVEPGEYQSQETGVGNLQNALADRQNQSEVGALSRIQNVDMVQEQQRKAQQEELLKKQEEDDARQQQIDEANKQAQSDAEETAKQYKHEQLYPDIPYRKDYNSIETPGETPPQTEAESLGKLKLEQDKIEKDKALEERIKALEKSSQQKAKASASQYFTEDTNVAKQLGIEPEAFHILPDTAKSILREQVKTKLEQQKLLENPEISKLEDITQNKNIPSKESLPKHTDDFDMGKRGVNDPEFKYPEETIAQPKIEETKVEENNPNILKKKYQDMLDFMKTTGKENTSAYQAIHDKLEGLKINTEGKIFGGISGLTTAAWNGSLNAVQLGLKGGLKLSEAIKSGIDWIKKNHPKSVFDEAAYHTSVMNHLLGQAKVLPNSGPANNVQQFNIQSTPIAKLRGIHASFMSPEVDKVERIGPVGKEVAGHMTDFYEQNVKNYGKYVNGFTQKIKELANLGGVANTIKNPKGYLESNTPELNNVRDWFWAKSDGTTLPQLTAREQAIKDEVVRSNTEVRKDQISKGIGNKTAINPDYLAQSFDPKVLQEIKQNPESAKTQQYKKAQIDYLKKKGLSQVDAESKWKEIAEPSNKIKSNTSAFFGPIDESAGLGIAKELRNPNLLDTQTKYLDRVARRFAYEAAIKPHEDKINSIGDNVSVKHVMDDISGNKYRDDSATSALTGIVSSQMMGTLTGEKDFGGNFTLGWQHTDPVMATKNMVKAWGNMKQNLADGYASGRIRSHMKALELDNGIDNFTDLAHKVRDITNAATGRNFFDQMARASSLGQAGFITDDFINQLAKGKLSKTGENWFNTFGKDTNWKSGKLTPEEKLTISGRYVDSTQGTYDYRGLPRQSVEGSWSPVLRLARWNIEKSNNFIKHTVNPALNGNFKPALMTTAGILVGGSIIQAITQLNTGRKKEAPTWNEIYQNSEKPSDAVMPLFYKLAGLTSAAGHLGMLGDVIAGTADVLYGKNRPQTYNNIVIEAASNMGALTAGYASSLARDGFNTDNLVSYISQVLENTSQNYRLMEGVLSQDKKADLSKANKERDLRVFDTISGNKIIDKTSPFKVQLQDSKAKEFKDETNIDKIPDEAIALIDRADKRSGGDPTKLQQELRSLKENSYQTMPNPKDKTQSKAFADFYDFLVKTQGQEEADKRVDDFIERNTINKIKSKLIP